MYYPDSTNQKWNNYEPTTKKVKVVTTCTERYDKHNQLISKTVVTVTEEIIDQINLHM